LLPPCASSSYFSTIPAPFPEIMAHAGSDPPASNFTTNVDQYKSQYLQGLLLDRWIFGGVAGGTFVDIGAHDGVAYSNSFVFEKLRGWRGVCNRTNPTVFAQLAVEQAMHTTLNCCVSDSAGTCLSSRFPAIRRCCPAWWINTSPNNREAASNGS